MKKYKSILVIGTLCVMLVLILFFYLNVNASTKTNGIEAFPSNYQPYLNLLKQKHNNWNFIALYTNLDWNNVVSEENIFGRSLVPKNYSDNWKNTKPSEYNIEVDAGWVDSSKKAVEYSIDPRNFLNEIRIFQFEELSYNASTNNLDVIEKILYGTEFYNKMVSYFDGSGNNISTNEKYSSLILKAAKTSYVSAFHLASRIKQEVGPFLTHGSISGIIDNYKGLYNFYNIGAASSNEPMGAIKNGLQYAKDGNGASQTIRDKFLIPWNTKERAITGGAIFIGDSYINVGQNTIYLQKFDVNDEGNNGLFWHQYMTNILAPYSESKSIYNGYQKNGLLNNSMTFVIPVFENMPEFPVQNPNINDNEFKTDNTNVYCNSNNVNIRTGPSTSYDIITTVSRPYRMVRIGKGIQNGEKWDKVLINNSIIGYIYQSYISEEPININIEFKEPLYENNYEISGLDYNKNKVIDIKNNIITDIEYDIVNNKNQVLKDEDLVGTGSKIRLKQNGSIFAEYSFILFGDANGNGKIDSVDLLVIQRHILEIQIMDKIYQTASTLVPNRTMPTSIDMLKIQRHILEIEFLENNKTVKKKEKIKTNNYIANIDNNSNLQDDNTNLETLSIENELLNPPFDNNITNYNLEVSNDKNNVNLLAIPENEKAKVNINGLKELKEGNNLIQVTVISESNRVRKTYKINIYKRNLDEEKKYIQEKNSNEQKLNQILSTNTKLVSNNYSAQKTSLQIKVNNLKTNGIIYIVLFLILVLVILVSLLIRYKKRKR